VSGLPTAEIGRTGLEVTRLGLGTAPLGDLFILVGDDEAQAVLQAAFDDGVTLVDTAPQYGLGLSEHRVGRFVRQVDRDSVVVATKVGRLLTPVPRGREREDTFWAGGLRFDTRFDYGYDGVMRSFEDSLQRLGLDRVDMLAIHDLDAKHFAGDAFERRIRALADGGARALEELRSSGALSAIGLGINALGSIPRVLDVVDLDYAIVAMPYTLLDQEALDVELPLCLERGVSVVIGAVFASGVLAVDEGSGTYGYESAPADVVSKVAAMREVCERHGVSLAAAALRFPLGHPAVAAVIPGALTADQVRENVARFSVEIPSEVWVELKAEGLLRSDAPVPAVAS
jgi:D-threo-aldose 1-dehydrogenase